MFEPTVVHQKSKKPFQLLTGCRLLKKYLARSGVNSQFSYTIIEKGKSTIVFYVVFIYSYYWIIEILIVCSHFKEYRKHNVLYCQFCCSWFFVLINTFWPQINKYLLQTFFIRNYFTLIQRLAGASFHSNSTSGKSQYGGDEGCRLWNTSYELTVVYSFNTPHVSEMANEENTGTIRSPESVIITVVRCKNLVS